jgi:hypothetical protein
MTPWIHARINALRSKGDVTEKRNGSRGDRAGRYQDAFTLVILDSLSLFPLLPRGSPLSEDHAVHQPPTPDAAGMKRNKVHVLGKEKANLKV